MKINIAIFTLLFIMNSLFSNQANMISVHEQNEDWSVLPILIDYPNKTIVDRNVSAYVKLDHDVLHFNFLIPIKGKLPPVFNRYRDGRLWDENSVELYFMDDKNHSHQYIFNLAGTIFDAKDKNRKWNGNTQVHSKIVKKSWNLKVDIPLTELEHLLQSNKIKFNAVVRSFQLDNQYISTFAPMLTTSFLDPCNMGILNLSEKGYVKSFHIKKEVKESNIGFTICSIDHIGKRRIERLKKTEKLMPISHAVEDVFSIYGKIANPSVIKANIKRANNDKFILELPDASMLKVIADSIDFMIGKVQCRNLPVKSTILLPVSPHQFSENNYDMTLTLRKKGKIIATRTWSRFLYDETPYDYDLNEIDVSEYYDGISGSFPNLTAALCHVDFSTTGLPSHLQVIGHTLIKDKIDLIIDGKPTDFKVNRTQKGQNTFRFSATSKAGTYQGQLDFDGLLWYECKLSPQNHQQASINISMNFRRNDDIMVSYTDLVWNRALSPHGMDILPFKETVGWQKSLADGQIIFMPLTSAVNITNGGYGISIYLPTTPAHLNLENYDRMMEIRRHHEKVLCRIHLSDGKKVWSNKEIALNFGIQPLPCRKFDYDANFKYRIARHMNYEFYQTKHPELENINVRPELLNTYSGNSQYNTFFWWTERHNHWTSSPEDKYVTKFRTLQADAIKKNIKIIPYFGFELSNLSPEYPVYADYALVMPFSNAYVTHKPFRKSGIPNKSYTVCYASSFGDHWIKGVSGFVKQNKVAGIYLDGTIYPRSCTNPNHGHLYKDNRNRIVPYFTTREMRRFAILLYAQIKKANTQAIIDLHASGGIIPATMSLVNVIWNGEQLPHFHPNQKCPMGDARIMFNGRLYGIPIQVLNPTVNNHQQRLWAQSLLFDTYVRTMEAFNASHTRNTFKLWKIFDKYDLYGQDFVPYYDTSSKYKDSNGNMLISYYKNRKRLALVISNYMNTVDSIAKIDVSDCHWNTYVDAFTGETLRPSGGFIYVPVKKEVFRLIISQ